MPVSSMISAFFCALLFPTAKFRSSSHHPQVILLSSSRRAPVVPHCTTLAPALIPAPAPSKSYPPSQMTISFVSNILFFISLYTF